MSLGVTHVLGLELLGDLDAALVEAKRQRGNRMLEREQGGQLVPVQLEMVATHAEQNVLHDVEPCAAPVVQLLRH